MIAVVGWLGTLLVVGAYLLLTLDRLKPGLGYQVLNLAGASMVGVSAAAAGLWSVVALQAAWSLIALASLLRKTDRRCQARESGGVRCERHRWHLGGHACPRALARHAWTKAGW